MRQYAIFLHRDDGVAVMPCVAIDRAQARGIAIEAARKEKEKGAEFVVVEIRCLRSPGDEPVPVEIPGQMRLAAVGVSYESTQEERE